MRPWDSQWPDYSWIGREGVFELIMLLKSRERALSKALTPGA